MPIVIVVLATVGWTVVGYALGLPEAVVIAGGPVIGWMVGSLWK